MAVGSALFNNAEGTVHLFEKRDGTWSHAQSFTSANSSPNGLFGTDVALSGDRLFIAESPAKATAQVHLYELNASGTWSLTESFEHLKNPEAHRIDRVVADGDTMAFVGEPDTGFAANGVLVHTWNGSQWQGGTLSIPGGARPQSLALDGDRLVTGVPTDHCAYTYRRSSDGAWTAANPPLMTCDDNANHPTAGHAVAIAENTVAVGDYAANASRGEVLAFDVSEGTNRSTEITGGLEGGREGYTLAMNEHFLVTGRGVLGGRGKTVVATVQPNAALFD